jgi:hypothetical protein
MPISSLLNENVLTAAMISFLEKLQFQVDINFITYIGKKKNSKDRNQVSHLVLALLSPERQQHY